MAHRPLNQVIAVLKGVKSRHASRCNEIHHQLQTPDVLTGQARSYQPRNEGDPVYPGEDKHVQVKAADHLHEMAELTTEMFDAEAALDYANCNAKANVVVDGKTVVENAPATYLIFLEKQLTDLHTTLVKCAVRDPSKVWTADPANRLHKALAIQTFKTTKVEVPLMLSAAVPGTNGSPGLPAQVKTTTKDIVEGTWTTTPMSGAISEADKKQYLDRIQRLIDAVKVAREQANMVDAPAQAVGKRILDFIGL